MRFDGTTYVHEHRLSRASTADKLASFAVMVAFWSWRISNLV